MRRSIRNRQLLDEDILLPITRGGGYFDRPHHRPEPPGRDYPRHAWGDSLLMHYVLRPLGRRALGYVWKAVIAILFCKVVLGVDLRTMWQVVSFAWNFGATGNDTMHGLMNQVSGVLQSLKP